MIRVKGKEKTRHNWMAQTMTCLITAGLTLMVSSVAQASTNTNYQLTAPQRLTINPNLGVQGVSGTTSRAVNRPRKSKSTQSANPQLVGTQLYQALNQRISSRSVKKAKSNAVITDAQRRNLDALNLQLRDSAGASSVKVAFEKNNGTPTLIKPLKGGYKVPALAGARPSKSAVAKQFLNNNRELLKLNNPDNELTLVRQTADTQNKTHILFQQSVNGVPVWGKQALVHLDANDAVYLFQGRYEPSITGLNTMPQITADTAIEKVLSDLNVSGTLPQPALSELMVYSGENGNSVLTYKVEVAPSVADRWVYFIDAASGAVVHKIFNIHKNVVQASGADLSNTVRTFNVWDAQDGSYYLIDPDTPTAGGNPDPVADGPLATGDTYILDAHNGDGSQLFYNTHTATTGWPDNVEVSAAYNTRRVYDYYNTIHSRNSVDGNGKNLMVVVHFQNAFDNAFWNGTFMVYGDGGSLFSPLAGCLDVAGHEMTHGVIETSAGLIYENQSGALNESFADVFGVMIDDQDWQLGEDCTLVSPGFLRSMQNPADGLSAQPTHMVEYQNLPNTPEGDNGGVHINSGIPNRAAYLIAEGLTAEGLGTSIGRTETEQIYYRAFTTYLTQFAQFIDARRALIQAADDLHGSGSTQSQAVAAAFDAVGIVEGGTTAPPDTRPTPTDPVAGDDIMVYLYPEDNVHDNPSLEILRLYTQTIGGDDVGAYNLLAEGDLPAFYTRPAAVSTDSGTFYLYVANDNNVYQAVFGGADFQLSTSGNIYSIAISPNDRYITYTTTDGNDNNIYVVDFDNSGSVTAYPIIAEDYQGGGTVTGNTILYADALAFDYTSNVIVFDALNCLSTPDSLCSNGAGYRYWSIGILDLIAGQFYFPIANQSPDFDLGYPSFAANNNYVITLDVQDYTNAATTGINSETVTIDFEAQAVNTVYDFGLGADPFWSVPSFWGGDDYVTLQAPASTPQVGNISASRVQINSSWQGISALEPVNNFAVAMPKMHRAGVRILNGTLESNTTLLDFGDVPSGQSSQLTITLSNPGNSDVNITNIAVNNGHFSHNGFNTRVPQGQSLTLTVSFAPTRNGSEVGNLIISNNIENTPLTISLVGSGSGFPENSDDGGGCFIATAAFGSYLHEDVMVLRHFRDQVLLQSDMGTWFVNTYYKYSPPIADKIAQSEVLRWVTRVLLTPIVYSVKYPLLGILLLMTIIAVGFRKRLSLLAMRYTHSR